MSRSPEYVYFAPLSEKLEDDLIYAIAASRLDAQACADELLNRGWSAEAINRQVAKMQNCL